MILSSAIGDIRVLNNTYGSGKVRLWSTTIFLALLSTNLHISRVALSESRRAFAEFREIDSMAEKKLFLSNLSLHEAANSRRKSIRIVLSQWRASKLILLKTFVSQLFLGPKLLNKATVASQFCQIVLCIFRGQCSFFRRNVLQSLGNIVSHSNSATYVD